MKLRGHVQRRQIMYSAPGHRPALAAMVARLRTFNRWRQANIASDRPQWGDWHGRSYQRRRRTGVEHHVHRRPHIGVEPSIGPAVAGHWRHHRRGSDCCWTPRTQMHNVAVMQTASLMEGRRTICCCTWGSLCAASILRTAERVKYNSNMILTNTGLRHAQDIHRQLLTA